MPTVDTGSGEHWCVCVCMCVHRNVRMFVCVVSTLTGSPAGGVERGRRRTAALLAFPWLRTVSGEGCGVEGEGSNSSNHDLLQDSGFNSADVILSRCGCSKTSRGCILPCLSSGLTVHVSFLARASLDLLLQQLQGFIPFPGLQVGRKASHPGGHKEFWMSPTTPGNLQ